MFSRSGVLVKGKGFLVPLPLEKEAEREREVDGSEFSKSES